MTRRWLRWLLAPLAVLLAIIVYQIWETCEWLKE